ncbi:hypothetical protein EDF53_3094 [Curtobacterium sp. PhB78]|nr:hypothetical protein EDF53_3094 [Curtobacterium sp. PhB78]
MARRRRDRWALGAAYSLPEIARGGPDYDVTPPDPVLAWVQFPDRILEVEARAIAYTERAVLVEWGFSQAAQCAWIWRDAIRAA